MGQNAHTVDSSGSLSLPGNLLLGTIVIKTTKACRIKRFLGRWGAPNIKKKVEIGLAVIPNYAHTEDEVSECNTGYG